MFCSNCGAQLADDAEFCGNCGQKVTKEAPQAPNPAPQPDAADKIGAAAEAAADKVGAVAEVAAEKAGAAAQMAAAKTSSFFREKFLPAVKKYLKWIILGVVVVVLVVAFFVTGSVMSNPGNVVSSFIGNLSKGDYAAAFDQLDIQESEFINGDLFAQYISGQTEENGTDFSQYSSYRVMTYNDYVRQAAAKYGIGDYADQLLEEDGNTLHYVAVAPDDSDGLEFTLNKQDSNFLLFWPTYKIDTEGMLADATIYTFPGCTVTIDGIQVAEGTPDEDTPEGLVPYTVPAMLGGDHDLVISSELTEEYESEISVYEGYTRTVSSLDLSDEVVNERFEAGQELLSTLVNGAIANTSFDQLGIAVTSDADALADIKEAYDDLLEDLHDDDGTGLKSITFTDFEDSSYYAELNSDSTYDCRIRFRYDYVSIEKNYSTDQLEDRASTYTHSSTFSFTYAYENGSWVLHDINSLYISY